MMSRVIPILLLTMAMSACFESETLAQPPILGGPFVVGAPHFGTSPIFGGDNVVVTGTVSHHVPGQIITISVKPPGLPQVDTDWKRPKHC